MDSRYHNVNSLLHFSFYLLSIYKLFHVLLSSLMLSLNNRYCWNLCRSSNLSLEAFESAVLSKFKSLKHVPIWKEERPQILRGGDELKLYRVYPLGMTQRQALYTSRFKGDADFRNHIESHPCANFEAIFV